MGRAGGVAIVLGGASCKVGGAGGVVIELGGASCSRGGEAIVEQGVYE